MKKIWTPLACLALLMTGCIVVTDNDNRGKIQVLVYFTRGDCDAAGTPTVSVLSTDSSNRAYEDLFGCPSFQQSFLVVTKLLPLDVYTVAVSLLNAQGQRSGFSQVYYNIALSYDGEVEYLEAPFVVTPALNL